MTNTSWPLPILPLEILGHIVELYAVDSIDEGGRSSSSLCALLSASLGLRDCALRVLCRDVAINCGDPQRNRKLREVLIPQTTNCCLGSIAPYVKAVHMMLFQCTSSPEALDEIFSLVDVIVKESCVCRIILDGMNRQDDMMEDDDPFVECLWRGLPLGMIQNTHKLIRMPTVDTLEVYAVLGLNQYLFEEESSSKGRISLTDIKTTTVTNHRFRSLAFKNSPMPYNIVLPNLKSIVADNLNPTQLQNVWKISLHAQEALEELEIDDEFFDNVPFFADTDNYEETCTIPPSTRMDMFPKLKVFKYSHVLFDPDATGAPTSFPQISFFAISNPVPELQSLSLAIRWGNVFSLEFAAHSKEEAITRMADPAWSLLDGILTMPGYFPNLRYFRLTLSQDVQLSMEDFLSDVQGSPCSRVTADDLQSQIAKSLCPSFCRLLKHPSILFRLDIEVTVEESV